MIHLRRRPGTPTRRVKLSGLRIYDRSIAVCCGVTPENCLHVGDRSAMIGPRRGGVGPASADRPPL